MGDGAAGRLLYITRDDVTGDVVLSSRPGAQSWDALFKLLHAANAPADFMVERPLNGLPQERGVFDDVLEENRETGGA